MGRVPKVLVDVKNPQSVVDYVSRIQRVVDGQIEFGSPQDPRDPASTNIADGTTQNGTLLNIAGSWVELKLDDVGNLINTNVTCIHNLGVAVLSASEPNVRWLMFGWQHSGAGAGAGSAVSAIYVDGAVTSNSIQLRFHAAARTVTVANPLKVCLFFVPAVHGIAQ